MISGTALKLDDQMHELESLSNGLQSATASIVLGESWGLSVYKGRVADDDLSLDILLTTLPRL